MPRKSTRTLALSAMFVTLMLILGYLESLIPIGTIPGIKLGISNSVLLLSICWLGIPVSFCLMAVKVILSGFLFSGVNAMMYAFAGGLLSMIVMSVMHRFHFSPVTTGIAGAAAHNAGQVMLAMIILETDKLIYYMAILMLVGIVTGFATGTAAKILMARLPYSLRPEQKYSELKLELECEYCGTRAKYKWEEGSIPKCKKCGAPMTLRDVQKEAQ